MMEGQERPPIRVKVQDKRRSSRPADEKRRAEQGLGGARPEAVEPSGPPESAGSGQTAAPAETAEAPESADSPQTAAREAAEAQQVAFDGDAQSAAEDAQPEYLDDLRRLQAEFDNYRKRMLREQTAMTERASARVLERLLPILDNLEAAIAHGEGGPGIALVHKELKRTLEEEGLVEIEALGRAFDPRVHEAFEAHEDPEVEEPTVARVMRRGYRVGERILRPAMVSVARPAESRERDAAEG
jgi:molecular chaperone GrpE